MWLTKTHFKSICFLNNVGVGWETNNSRSETIKDAVRHAWRAALCRVWERALNFLVLSCVCCLYLFHIKQTIKHLYKVLH